MIYILYFLVVIGVLVFSVFLLKRLQKFQDQRQLKRIAQRYHPMVLNSEPTYFKDGKITADAEEAIENIRSLQGDAHNKQTIIQKMNYKLTYVYGSKPLKHFIRLYLTSMIFFGVILLVSTTLSMFILVPVVLVLGLFGAIMATNRAFDKKIAHFLNNFVYAMDIIVRGVRSGLSINLCFKQVVQDLDIVVGEQFLAMLDDYRLGLPTEQVMDRFMKRFPLKEVNFFCLSIMIQGKTGGNLAEIISSLAKILRNRKSLLLKIQTLSSEAKTSAMIMGGLPVAVIGLLYISSPDYISILTTTDSGNIVMLGCAVWMGIGALIMRKIINFYQ